MVLVCHLSHGKAKEVNKVGHFRSFSLLLFTLLTKYVFLMIRSVEITAKKSEASTAQTAQKEKEYILNELEEIYKLVLPSNAKKMPLKADEDEETNHFLKSSIVTSSSMSHHPPHHKKEDLQTITKRQRLLLSLAHVCLMYGEVNLCSQIVGFLKETELVNEEFSLEVELIECEQTIK